MNRQLKFRVWDASYKRFTQNADGNDTVINLVGELVYPVSNNFEQYDCNKVPGLRKFESNRFIIQQFTGLTDKNGKKIYEGDILNNIVNRYIVEYSNERARWIAKALFYSKPIFDLDVVMPSFIIGNIFENPELLESLI